MKTQSIQTIYFCLLPNQVLRTLSIIKSHHQTVLSTEVHLTEIMMYGS